MTREEAIKQLEGLYEHCESMMTSDEPVWSKDREALRVALSSLRPITREQVEKMRGEWTGNFNTHCSRCDAFSTMAFIGQGGNFCPNCGAPMTDEAVDLLAKRLEEVLKDADD